MLLPFAMRLTALALSLFSFSTTAQSTTNPPAAVFTYAPPTRQGNIPGDHPSDSHSQFVFALNVDQETKDLYIHISAPNGNDWMGVGFGSQMKGSHMLIAYAAKDQKNITLSSRIASGHSEPEADGQGPTCSLVDGDGLTNGISDAAGTMEVNAFCPNATVWSLDIFRNESVTGTPIDPTKQPFIFAVGPGTPGGAALHSDSIYAPLRRHEAYGSFTMDVTKAFSQNTSSAGVPKPDSNGAWTLSNASDGSAQADNDPAPVIHGLIMCVCFVILFPLGALILRVFHRVIAHAIIQGVGLFFVCCATAGGIVVSMQFNRSKHFASAHQIIGILLLLALLGQLGLGILHHRIFKKTQQPTKLGKIHKYLGPAILLFGFINAPLGFVLAGNPHLCLPYFIILLLAVIVYLTVRFGSKICCRGRRKQQGGGNLGPAGAMPAGGEGYQYPQFGAGAGQGQGQGAAYMQAPPAYGRQASYGASSEDVPLRPYESQTSNIGAPPSYPRPMV